MVKAVVAMAMMEVGPRPAGPGISGNKGREMVGVEKGDRGVLAPSSFVLIRCIVTRLKV